MQCSWINPLKRQWYSIKMPTPWILCQFKIPLLFCHFLCFSMLLFFLVTENIRWPWGLNVQRCCLPGRVAAVSKPSVRARIHVADCFADIVVAYFCISELVFQAWWPPAHRGARCWTTEIKHLSGSSSTSGQNGIHKTKVYTRQQQNLLCHSVRQQR